ncbi:HNH endonuclease [Achromobacter xylosoxidans]|uniref:HNH endonuclease n=1 Tax=Alcaligenes xylosoxydans xylosoxydans TaxID=85698 RepID=A0A424W562_ALCXX|nr:HNH endonuclease [Achromobacter xylosoxidans]MBD0868713.1 HNH endonuclease [Achromobacter xylosoxidans]QNP88994.1 HNH endonuclease [Achromobacter xylosoxidans]RPJ88452.1 HNH endonuclease [Achromobacter xylosoxidans]
MPSYELVNSLLEYDQETGVFTWRVYRGGKAKAGLQAGYLRANGYLQIKVQGQFFEAHRLAWLLSTGSWPRQHIDHLDGDPSNNRIRNLRDVSRQINAQNQRRPRDRSTSGLLGVSRHYGKWQARIGLGGRNHYLGTFTSPEEAHAAYLVAKRKLHEGCAI